MKGLLVAAATLCAGTFLGYPQAAHAKAAHRIAIEPFTGLATSAFREQTARALTDLGHVVLPEREVAGAMSSLRLMRVSDNFGALARELKATLYVQGAIWTEARKLLMGRLVVRGPTGVLVGEADWSGRNLNEVLFKIRSTVGARLTAILGGRADGRPADPPPVAFRRVNNAGVGTAVEVDPGEGVRRGPSRAAAGSPNEDEENTSEISAAKAEGPGRGPGWSTIDVSAGTHLYSRAFTYDDNQVGLQRDHRHAAVPALMVSLDYFFVPWLGVSLSGEYSLAVASQDGAGNRFRTSSLGYSAVAQARFNLFGVSIVAGGGFGENAFVVGEDSAPDAPEVADVVYRQLKGGASIRIPLGSRVALLGGGNYLHLLGVGELSSAGYFPNMRGLGGEGFGGLAVAIASRFELRATGTLRQYLFQMNSLPTDPRHADGAVDQYLGVNLVLAYRN